MRWYKFNIDNLSDEVYTKWYSLMSHEKKARIDKMMFEDDKKRSVVGEMLAKNAIAEISGIIPEAINMVIEKNGKPYIESGSEHFNISHSGRWVVCAVDNKPIGIDIEKIKPINLKIAKKFFTTEENNYIFNKAPEEEDYTTPPDDSLLKRFFEVWTGKEAYLKYTGQGLCDNLNKLNINRDNIETQYIDDYIISIYTEK